MWLSSFIFTLILSALISLSSSTDNGPTCGYSSCPEVKPGMLNVHLIPHTHDDVGWLKTVDQYFYGTRTEIQHAGVKTIIDSVLYELELDPSRRFIWVESAFLWQWWSQASDEASRAKLLRLVQTGQLEITGGGWSMNDEAVTHYQSTIDQFTWGFRKMDDLFGTCGRPHIGWQIDPFGHSRDTASMMAQMGFDGLFFARLDYRDKKQRMESKTPELVWQASQNLGKSSWLFTNVLFNHYSPPRGFCFDILCHDDPIIDDRTSKDYNLEDKVNAFTEHALKQNESYNSGHILMTMGNDFNYMDAKVWYTNLDKLIKYVNARGEMNLFYSTPACYLKAVNDANLTWTTKQDDFFPYASDSNTYWTGYYTSRPTLKYYERQGNNFLQVLKQLHVLASIPDGDWKDLSSLRETMGIMQHHDAITGTEKQHVAFDYALRINQAFQDSFNSSSIAMNKLMAKNELTPNVQMEHCLLLNISQCATSEQKNTFIVTLYNPLARLVSRYVRLPVPQNRYKVFDPSGNELVTQLVPIPQSVFNIPGRESSATQELVFKASDLPPLGFKSYLVEKIEDNVILEQPVTGEDRFQLQNDQNVTALFSESTNLLISMKRGTQLETKLEQKFKYYEAFSGGNWMPETRSSGAYIFRPAMNEAMPFDYKKVSAKVFKGPLVQEIHQEIDDWVSQVIRIYQGEYHLELEWQVGPIPVDDQIGREIVTEFSTGWKTNGLFYTDSNGRESMERNRDSRDTFEVDMKEPISANYYPVTTHITIVHDDKELSVLPDRAQGGSSLGDGDIELMLHRRLLNDDAFGVGEALNETAFGEGLVARGRHIVVLESHSDSETVRGQTRRLSQSHMVMAPWLMFTSTELTPQQWQQQYVTQYSGLDNQLPDNVHLLTLEPWKDDSLLLRLEHFFEKGDGTDLSKPAIVELKDLFSAFSITSVQEMTLGANQKIEEKSRLVWHVDSSSEVENDVEPPTVSNNFAVSLQPMQIRTFIMKVTPRSTAEQSPSLPPRNNENIPKHRRSILQEALRFHVIE